MANAISIRKVFPKEGLLEHGFVRGESGPGEPLYARFKLLDLVWSSPKAVDKNGARLINAVCALVDHPGQTRGNAFSDVTDEEGNFLPQFDEMAEDVFIQKMKGYATNIKSFAACFDGVNVDGDIDVGALIGKIGHGVYMPGLGDEAVAAGFTDVDALKSSGLLYSGITEWISKESFEAHTAAGHTPIDTRKRLWATEEVTPTRVSRRGTADNGKADGAKQTEPDPAAASGGALPTSSRRRPGVQRAAGA